MRDSIGSNTKPVAQKSIYTLIEYHLAIVSDVQIGQIKKYFRIHTYGYHIIHPFNPECSRMVSS